MPPERHPSKLRAFGRLLDSDAVDVLLHKCSEQIYACRVAGSVGWDLFKGFFIVDCNYLNKCLKKPRLVKNEFSWKSKPSIKVE